MKFDVFLNFDGNCREAVAFYAQVFKTPEPQFMTYGDAPGSSPNEQDADRILYACLPIFGCNMMFSDCPSDMTFIRGNSIGLTLGAEDKQEITRLFHALKEGGQVHMDLTKTFYAELYGMVTDKYGILWHLTGNSAEANA